MAAVKVEVFGAVSGVHVAAATLHGLNIVK
jgi:hypothetical protein